MTKALAKEVDYSKYKKENIVHCLAIYQWANKLNIVEFQALFEKIADLIGSKPDDTNVGIKDEWKSKAYKYKTFIKRDIIHQNDWVSLLYDWRRQPDARLYLAGSIDVTWNITTHFSVEIDEAATDDVKTCYEAIVSLVCETLQPQYGIGFFVPYFWEPRALLSGTGVGYSGPEENLFHDSREAFALKGEKLGGIMVKRPEVFGYKLFDVLPINFINERHLTSPIQGTKLKSWIENSKRGKLNQVSPTTWRWDVPKQIEASVREALVSANLIADPFWVDLGWQ